MVESKSEYYVCADLSGMKIAVKAPEFNGVVTIEEAMKIEEMVSAIVVVITKEDILYLLDEATDSTSNFEMDEITDDSIKNEAHKIIYKSIYSKFSNLLSNKKQFLDECDGLYKDALQKYKPKEEVTPSNDSSLDNSTSVDLSSFKM